jgi:hypothetical protein
MVTDLHEYICMTLYCVSLSIEVACRDIPNVSNIVLYPTYNASVR